MKKLFAASLLALGTTAAFAASVTLNGTVRDFIPGALVQGSSNPDFESDIGGLKTGMVASTLSGSAPTPISFGSPGYISSAASFAEWFGAAAPNKSHAITLNETAPGSGIYSYASNSFFPIDNDLLGNQGRSHN